MLSLPKAESTTSPLLISILSVHNMPTGESETRFLIRGSTSSNSTSSSSSITVLSSGILLLPSCSILTSWASSFSTSSRIYPVEGKIKESTNDNGISEERIGLDNLSHLSESKEGSSWPDIISPVERNAI